MNTSKKLLEIVRIKLLDCKNTHEYINIYEVAYN